jgi:hypothetical protein
VAWSSKLWPRCCTTVLILPLGSPTLTIQSSPETTIGEQVLVRQQGAQDSTGQTGGNVLLGSVSVGQVQGPGESPRLHRQVEPSPDSPHARVQKRPGAAVIAGRMYQSRGRRTEQMCTALGPAEYHRQLEPDRGPYPDQVQGPAPSARFHLPLPIALSLRSAQLQATRETTRSNWVAHGAPPFGLDVLQEIGSVAAIHCRSSPPPKAVSDRLSRPHDHTTGARGTKELGHCGLA